MSTEVTKEVPIKENMAIAAFMGKTVYPLRGTKEFKKWKGEACDYQWFELKYHEDWNQLLSVATKIRDIYYEPTFYMNRTNEVAEIMEGLIWALTKIEKTELHKAVYAFIQWYQSSLNTSK